MGKATANPSAKPAKKATANPSKFALKEIAKLNESQKKILLCLAKLRAAHIVQPKKDFLQLFSGNGKTQAGYEKNLSILKKQNLIVYPSKGLIAISEDGLGAIGKKDRFSEMTTQEFHENIKSLFSPKGKMIFDAIADGNKYDKMDIAKKLNYDMTKLSGFEKDLSKMKTLGFLNKDSKTIQLSAKCFLPNASK